MELKVTLILCAAILVQTYGATIQFNPNVGNAPKIVFNPSMDALNIKNILHSTHIDGAAIVRILSNRSSLQRSEILAYYKQMYQKDLKEEFKTKFDEDVSKLLIGLVTPMPEFYAEELYNAMKDLGTDENALIEVLATLNNVEMREVNSMYEKKYGKTLASDIEEDTSSHFRKLMMTLATKEHNEGYTIDPALAKSDAKKLYEAGEERWGTDEAMFIEILTQRNPQQLKRTFAEYKSMTGNDFMQAIDCEFSGSIKKGLLAVSNIVISGVYDYVAGVIHKYVESSGLSEITRTLAMRDQTDMWAIKAAYAKKFGTSLEQAIGNKMTGEYQTCLMSLVKGQ